MILELFRSLLTASHSSIYNICDLENIRLHFKNCFVKSSRKQRFYYNKMLSDQIKKIGPLIVKKPMHINNYTACLWSILSILNSPINPKTPWWGRQHSKITLNLQMCSLAKIILLHQIKITAMEVENENRTNFCQEKFLCQCLRVPFLSPSS